MERSSLGRRRGRPRSPAPPRSLGPRPHVLSHRRGRGRRSRRRTTKGERRVLPTSPPYRVDMSASRRNRRTDVTTGTPFSRCWVTRAARGSRRCAPHSDALSLTADSHLSAPATVQWMSSDVSHCRGISGAPTPARRGCPRCPQRPAAETDDLQGGTTVKARRLFLAVAAAAALSGIAVGAGSAGSERSSEGCGSKLYFSCGRRVTRRFPGLPSSRRSGTPTSRSTGASTPATTWPPPGHGHRGNTALRDNAWRLLHRVRQLRRRGHKEPSPGRE